VSWRTSPRPAVIVAESLRRLPDPPFAAGPGPCARPDAVASAIARSLAPPVSVEPGPGWLRESQRGTFARALAGIRRYGGALVADPVGSGKTWIALALARATSEGAAVVIAPSVLREQWERCAERARVDAMIQSHEQWSRNPIALPPGLVIVDESHRFRHPQIRRYANLAPALIGRDGVLLSATPAVNRLADVAHQLLLFARDDCLAGAGIPSLLDALERDEAPPGLADLVIAGARAAGVPAIIERTVGATEAEERDAAEILQSLEALRLSPSRPISALIAGVFAGALASSRAALLASLGRYRNLLLQGSDASRAGLRLGRRELAAFLGPDAEQTVLWPLLTTTGTCSDLVGEDLPALEDCITSLRERNRMPEPKLTRLTAILEDAEVAVVFSGARATVDLLRRSLVPASRVAWVSGAGAGIGPVPLARRDVLRWFGPGAKEHELAPRILVATDVASEGLDLQRAHRVVHYDLPWTAVRLDQRAGRAVRLESRHAGVEIVTLLPPAVVESRLRLLARLARKRPLPARLGLGPSPEPVWQWRAGLAGRFRGEPVTGAAIIDGAPDADLVCVELRAGETRVSSFALARIAGDAWTPDHTFVAAILARVEGGAERPADPALIARVLSGAQRQVRTALLGASGALWRIRPLRGAARSAFQRLQSYARDAIRRRDRTSLALADRGIAFLRRGQTAGERLLTQRLAEVDDTGLESELVKVPRPDQSLPPLRARITGVLLIRG
jgi:hypothetical protein